MVNFCVVGLGLQGSRYAHHILNDVENADLAVVCSSSKEKASEWCANHYTDYGLFLKDEDVEVVVIATPPFMHAEQAIQAIESGKHVIIEKPIATTIEDAEKILATSKKFPDKKALVSFPLRYSPMTLTLKELAGGLGELSLLNLSFETMARCKDWGGDKILCGGAIMELGIHFFDLLNFFEVYPENVFCTAESESGLEDSFSAEMFNSIRAMVSVDAKSQKKTRVIEIIGDKGVVKGEYVSGKIEITNGSLKEIRVENINTLIPMLKDFVDSIVHDKDPKITIQDGIKSLRIAEACYRSVESRKTVSI